MCKVWKCFKGSHLVARNLAMELTCLSGCGDRKKLLCQALVLLLKVPIVVDDVTVVVVHVDLYIPSVICCVLLHISYTKEKNNQYQIPLKTPFHGILFRIHLCCKKKASLSKLPTEGPQNPHVCGRIPNSSIRRESWHSMIRNLK